MWNYGSTAVVRYVGTLSDGSVFDSTEGIDPLEFQLGSGSVIHGFDNAVRNMEIGECSTITIPCKDAFGEYSAERVEHGPMYAIPNAKDIEVGKLFYFVTEEGLKFPARVTSIDEGMATIDFNHPLAGEDLTFEIELLDVRG